jgi:hypothetical protein
MGGAESAATGAAAGAVSTATEAAAGAASTALGAAKGGLSKLGKDLSKTLDGIESKLPEFYLIALWGYCEGRLKGKHTSISNCTSPSFGFWFNFTKVLGLDESWIGAVFGNRLGEVSAVYEKVSKGISFFYIMAIVTTVLTLVASTSVSFVWWGGLFTSICVCVSLFLPFQALAANTM